MLLNELTETFKSQAQRGYFYARAAEGSSKWKRMAKEFEEETPKGKKLPYHVRKKNSAINASPAGDESEDISLCDKALSIIDEITGTNKGGRDLRTSNFKQKFAELRDVIEQLRKNEESEQGESFMQ